MARRFGIVILLVLCLFASGCQTQLFGNLAEEEANAVLAALLDASIPAAKAPGEEGMFAVTVDSADFARAVALLEELALPARHYDDLGTVFAGGAMFSTPIEEKARYLYAMQEELSRTMAAIDGVLDARVHLVLPEQDQLGRQLQTPSAGIFIKHVDDVRHDPLTQQREIVRLVAAAVPDLAEENIVVTFFPVPAKAPPPPPAWSNVLGVRVAGESAGRLWLILGAAAFALLGVTATFIFLLRRKRPA